MLAVGVAAPASALDCPSDDALSEAAAALLLEGARRPSADALSRAARAAGSDAPVLHALDVSLDRGGDTALATWLAGLRERSDAPLACGEATSATRRLVIAVARGGWLDEDMPVRSEESGLALPVVRGGLAPGFAEPLLAIRDASGELHRIPVDPRSLAAGFVMPAEVEPPAQVQLVARGPTGPRPVAERLVGAPPVDEDAPLRATTAVVAARPPHPQVTSAEDLPEILDSLREAADAGPLRHNRLLTSVAARHAADVCREARVAHELEPGADPEARLAAAGLRARVVGEVIARAPTLERALAALARSPSHHATLVDRRFTDAGLAHAEDPNGRTCVVVLLAAWPRPF